MSFFSAKHKSNQEQSLRATFFIFVRLICYCWRRQHYLYLYKPRHLSFATSILLSIIAIGLVSFSQDADAATAIEVSGNERTKVSYIKKLTNICLNDFSHARRSRKNLINLGKDTELIRQTKQLYLKQCLTNSGLFFEVQIVRFDKEKIEIIVQDKWSLLALPSYSAGPDPISVYWGLLIFDFNVGGRGQLVGFIFNRQNSEEVNSYSLLYDIPYLDTQGKFGFSLAALNRNQIYYSYEGKDWNYRVNEQFNFLWLRLKHRLTPEFSLTYGVAPSFLGFKDEVYRGGRNVNTPAEIENHAQEIQSATLNTEWNNLQRRYYYERGFSFSNTIFHQLHNSQKNPDTASLMNLYVGVPTYKQQVFQWNLEAGFRNNVERYNSWRIGGELGARAIPPDGAWSQHFAITSFDYQIPLAQGQYGYWNLGPFVDFGYLWKVQHRPEEELGYYAYGLASYVHLRRVNVPAFGLFIGTNNKYRENYVSFFAGFRF